MTNTVRICSVAVASIFLVACITLPQTDPSPAADPVAVVKTEKQAPKRVLKQTPPEVSASAESPGAAAPEAPSVPPSVASAAAVFQQGDYAVVIRQLTPLSADSTLSVPERLQALKLLAFAQCLTGAPKSCQRSFDRAFKLDRKFDLAPAEHGHPKWAHAFALARKANPS
jgi:hypothetical protein